MTKAEKFKEIFDIEHTEITDNFWDERYEQYCPWDCYECGYNCGKPYVACEYCKYLEECLSNNEAIKEVWNGDTSIHKRYVGLCKMQKEVQTMEQVDEWVTSPQEAQKFIYDPRYTLAYCECPVPFNKMIVIDKWKTKKINGFYNFYCTECGLHGSINA